MRGIKLQCRCHGYWQVLTYFVQLSINCLVTANQGRVCFVLQVRGHEVLMLRCEHQVFAVCVHVNADVQYVSAAQTQREQMVELF